MQDSTNTNTITFTVAFTLILLQSNGISVIKSIPKFHFVEKKNLEGNNPCKLSTTHTRQKFEWTYSEKKRIGADKQYNNGNGNGNYMY